MAARKTAPTVEATVYTVSSLTGLNVREKPDKAAKVLRVLGHGKTVQQDGDAPKGWIAVKGGGYVMAEYLK